jgi:NADPH2:quinone reductase
VVRSQPERKIGLSHFAGEWVLVTASAGGVGIAAVQIAKGALANADEAISLTHFLCAALGAKVIGAAGSQRKLDVTKLYGGADYVVDYTKPNWQKEVMKITAGHGVDVIYDPVGMIRGPSPHSVSMGVA